MENSFFFLEVMLLIMLAIVGALVVWLHFRLEGFSRDRKKLPLLADSLTNSMTQAYEGVSKLETAVREHSPELEKKVSMAKGSLHELSYVLDRAERLLARLDATFERVGGSPAVNHVADHEESLASTKSVSFDVQQKSRNIAEKLGESVNSIPLAGNAKEANVQVLDQPLRKASAQKGSQIYSAVAAGKSSTNDISEAEQELRQALAGRL